MRGGRGKGIKWIEIFVVEKLELEGKLGIYWLEGYEKVVSIGGGFVFFFFVCWCRDLVGS